MPEPGIPKPFSGEEFAGVARRARIAYDVGITSDTTVRLVATVENLEQAAAALAVQLQAARSLRLEWPSIRAAANPEIHTPARTIAYLTAQGWVKDHERLGGENWHSQPGGEGRVTYVFVPLITNFVDWDKRMAELAYDLADARGTGELQILADIAEAGNA